MMVDLKASLRLSSQEVSEGLHYGIKLVPVGLSFHWILWSRVREVIIIRDINDFRLLWCHVTVLELAWGRSHTRVATSKTRQIMVFLVGNISLYRVHDFDPLTNPWSVFYTNQSPSSIHYLWSISRYGGQSQCCWSKEKSPAGTNCWYSAHAAAGET